MSSILALVGQAGGAQAFLGSSVGQGLLGATLANALSGSSPGTVAAPVEQPRPPKVSKSGQGAVPTAAQASQITEGLVQQAAAQSGATEKTFSNPLTTAVTVDRRQNPMQPIPGERIPVAPNTFDSRMPSSAEIGSALLQRELGMAEDLDALAKKERPGLSAGLLSKASRASLETSNQFLNGEVSFMDLAKEALLNRLAERIGSIGTGGFSQARQNAAALGQAGLNPFGLAAPLVR